MGATDTYLNPQPPGAPAPDSFIHLHSLFRPGALFFFPVPSSVNITVNMAPRSERIDFYIRAAASKLQSEIAQLLVIYSEQHTCGLKAVPLQHV